MSHLFLRRYESLNFLKVKESREGIEIGNLHNSALCILTPTTNLVWWLIYCASPAKGPWVSEHRTFKFRAPIPRSADLRERLLIALLMCRSPAAAQALTSNKGGSRRDKETKRGPMTFPEDPWSLSGQNSPNFGLHASFQFQQLVFQNGQNGTKMLQKPNNRSHLPSLEQWSERPTRITCPEGVRTWLEHSTVSPTACFTQGNPSVRPLALLTMLYVGLIPNIVETSAACYPGCPTKAKSSCQ
jgi:hypothetical protein